MSARPVIVVFDVGKTNKKLFLFDENYQIVFEKSARFIETVDEDGFPCENLESLRLSVFDSLSEVFRLKEFNIKAVNFSSYGASFVYAGEDGKPAAPLYNYLKPYPVELSEKFYNKYGGEESFSLQTASPVLGSLNSGLQLYRLKIEQPEIFSRVKYALHLPQYLSFLLTGVYYSDLTSIGCHTAMWDFEHNRYHEWIQREGVALKLPPIVPANKVSPPLFPGTSYKIGCGLHDSSAALIPYLVNFNEPFVLISTGTWCISLNPFNHHSLTLDELKKDCLSFLQYKGQPVKASRLFSGNEYEQQVKRIAEHFDVDAIRFRNINYNPDVVKKIKKSQTQARYEDNFQKESVFATRDLAGFKNDTEAYHQLVLDLVNLQAASTQLVLKNTPVKRIFVDGGFSKNNVFMNLLAAEFSDLEVFAASMAQASAVGAALTIHSAWNSKQVPNDIIQLKYFSAGRAAP
ncbi:FGGY-family carbohydrate kinase [Mucilaginibacter sp. L3T2-6]|uniref:FGGY-family carbohydrate kinase n=1 Tax=Mucilaginibacter sp. L3T2-6 TaxID=3062491 RepID=UPI002676AB2D|nr:FGGY family carbohydrate kinase [Mucilaginibacter sp. L3T2-6]MDO3640858.1 FGGY family carbohydrate kinase [Mucilaginibacter sp. L3T2-6]MDV6213666.1 FGGY family carbohydrate kinase [Mucilaginibacter sp. L3T2-6]